jgi:hypothetical protein
MPKAERFEALQDFAAVGKLYRAHLMDPNWKRYPDRDTCPWDGIALFLWSYAFERQGRRPDYSPVAADVVKELKREGFRIDQPEAATEAWDRFKKRLEGNRLNIANNPMAPKGTEYERKDREGKSTKHITASPSAIEVASQLGRSIVTHVRDLLRADQVRRAHALVAGTNGVGDKIASLLLRDVASYYDLNVATDRHLLQPVDTWIRRATELCLNVESPPEAVARAIVDACHSCNVNPEHVNDGMWYFGAMVAQSAYRLHQAVENRDRFRSMTEEHVSALRDVVAVYGQMAP